MIAILSDIHGNLPALQAALDAAERMGCNRIISLGDVTGYYAEPGKCIDLLIEHGAIQLLGNHDSYLVMGTGCPRSRVVNQLLQHQRKAVTQEQIRFLSTLKSRHDEDGNSFVHGGWADPLDQYLYEVSESSFPDTAERFFSGHTHIQILAAFNGKTYCNPGSVGQPRDGDPRAAFATLEGRDIALHRVEYDIDETVRAMREAGFDESRLWENLYAGTQIGGRVHKVVVKA